MKFAEETSDHGVVTSSESQEYFSPNLHDTWGEKSGGRVHIDIGCGGYHVMLDRHYAPIFVDFIRGIRQKRT